MSDNCECPICMDVIDVTKNCVTTECGHKFHCSCLMQNAAHNGFGCPFCRTAMAEEPAQDDDEDDVSTDWTDDDGDDEIYDDYALRGLRFMTNNLEGNPHDILDVHDENEESESNAAPEEEEVELPTPAFIAAKLTAQGVTMEQLVKALLVDHGEYEDHRMFDDIDNANGDIFGKMRIIISNYSPDEPATPPQQEDHSQQSTPLPVPVSIPTAPVRISEPKVSIITPRRLSMEFNECMNE
jgi:hypothetical protein